LKETRGPEDQNLSLNSFETFFFLRRESAVFTKKISSRACATRGRVRSEWSVLALRTKQNERLLALALCCSNVSAPSARKGSPICFCEEEWSLKKFRIAAFFGFRRPRRRVLGCSKWQNVEAQKLFRVVNVAHTPPPVWCCVFLGGFQKTKGRAEVFL
jgi:hypothetical protein